MVIGLGNGDKVEPFPPLVRVAAVRGFLPVMGSRWSFFDDGCGFSHRE